MLNGGLWIIAHEIYPLTEQQSGANIINSAHKNQEKVRWKDSEMSEGVSISTVEVKKQAKAKCSGKVHLMP